MYDLWGGLAESNGKNPAAGIRSPTPMMRDFGCSRLKYPESISGWSLSSIILINIRTSMFMKHEGTDFDGKNWVIHV